MLCLSRCALTVLRDESGLGIEIDRADAGAFVPSELMLAEGRCPRFGDEEAEVLGALLVPATGSDRPRSLPLLATPTPQVSCVL
jgi:hypothetical protein